ncbi:hypothetical protein WDW86_12565 [Bdellovibrionota bacterium FG-2]
MNIHKILLTMVLIVCSMLNLSMAESDLNDGYGILDNEDYLMMERQERPALHSVAGDSPSWESYNRWLCFTAAELTLDCRDHESDQCWDLIAPEERDGKGYFAVMEVNHEDRHFRFESPSWLLLERCREQTDAIQKLLVGQNGFCVFAADIPSDDDLNGTDDGDFSVWAFYGFKTQAGRSMVAIYDPSGEPDSENNDDGLKTEPLNIETMIF